MSEEPIIYSDWMYIPKGVLYEPSIKASLTFIQKGYKDDKRISGWKEDEHYLLVPRDFYKRTHLEKKGLQLLKQIPEYEKIDLENNIVLDKLDYGDGRPIQKEAFDALKKAPNGVLNLACGKGKTVIALKYICDYERPAIVIVETLDLLHQWKERIEEFIDTEFKIGVIQGKPETWRWRSPIAVAMIQTLAKHAEDIPREMREYFGLVVYDEVHHLSSKFFVKTAPMFYGKRVGLTATPKREDGLEKLYYAHIGAPFYRDIQQPLTPDVFFYSFDLSVDWDSPMTKGSICDRTGELSFPKLWGFVGQAEEFQQKVAHLLLSVRRSGRKTLALSHRVDTLKLLHERIEKTAPGASGLVIGEVDADTRRKRLKGCQIVLGTMQLAKEGLDEKSLDTLFILEPFKAEGILQQAAGRILRPYPDKKKPVIAIMRLNHQVGYALTARLRRHFKKWPTKVEIQTLTI